MRKITKKTWVRIGWLSLAILFLMSAVILTALIGYQATHQNNSANKQNQEANNLTCKVDSSIKPNQPAADGGFSDTKIASFEPVAKIDKLECIDVVQGRGTAVKPSSTVTAHYVGALAKDGTIFDSSYKTGQPAIFPLSGVIEGWRLGVPGMKVGGTRRLLIPAAQAYGSSSPTASIPPDSDMVFDITLINVQ